VNGPEKQKDGSIKEIVYQYTEAEVIHFGVITTFRYGLLYWNFIVLAGGIIMSIWCAGLQTQWLYENDISNPFNHTAMQTALDANQVFTFECTNTQTLQYNATDDVSFNSTEVVIWTGTQSGFTIGYLLVGFGCLFAYIAYLVDIHTRSKWYKKDMDRKGKIVFVLDGKDASLEHPTLATQEGDENSETQPLINKEGA
jgi:hypothetical protein